MAVIVNALTLASSAVSASVSPGAISVVLDELTVVSSAVHAFPTKPVPLGTLVLNLATVPLTGIGVGATSVVVNTLTIASSAPSMSPIFGASYVVVNTLTLVSSIPTLENERIVQVNTLTVASSAVFPGRISTDFLGTDDLALLQAGKHVMKVYGSPLVPDTIWTARVNDPSLLWGDTVIAFDTGSGSAFALIEALQEVWIGSTAGGNDVGKFRIRGISSGDGGVTGSVTVAQHSSPIGDNYYLTFKLDYPIRQLFPFLEVDGTFKKDRDIAYTDENTEPRPIAVVGPDRAFWFDAGVGSLVVDIDMSESYPVAEGATMSSYSLSVLPAAGASVAVSGGTGIGTVTFTTVGQRWLKFSVTDSNGKTQITYRCYFVCSLDPSDSTFPLIDFNTVNIVGDWNRGGWSTGFLMNDNAALDDIPDNTKMLIWSSTWYGDTEKHITPLMPDETETIMNGFVMRDSAMNDMQTGAGHVAFEVVTANEMMRRFNFSVTLEVVEPLPDEWWKYEEWLTVGRAIHHLWREHSTIFEVVDVIGLMDNTLRRPYTEFDESDLYTMADGFSKDRSIRSHLVCDKHGRMHMTPDLQLLTDYERDSIPHVFEITKADISGQIVLNRQHTNPVAFVKVAGFAWDGSFITDDRDKRVPDAQPYCASAPGYIPAYEGRSVYTLDRQTWLSQDHANQIAGRVFAQQNNPYNKVPLTFHGNYFGVFDVAAGHWYRMSLQAGDTPRGVIWTDQRLIARSVRAQIDTSKGSITVVVDFEAEADGRDGVEGWCLSDMPDITGIEQPPLVGEYPDALMTGSEGTSSYFKPGYEKNWLNRLPDGVEDIERDPFWVSKQDSISSNDAIVWLCGQGFIKRSDDALQTAPVDVTPANDPPNDSGDAIAPTVADVTFVRIEGSWVYASEFCGLATWQNADGDWRSWLLYTDDDGANWDWKTVGLISPNCFVSSWGADTNVTATTDKHLFYGGFRQNAGALAILSGNKLVLLVSDQVFDNTTIYGYVCDISGDVVTPGPERTLATGATDENFGAIGIDDDNFVLTYWRAWPTNDPPEQRTRSYSVSGDTITLLDTDDIVWLPGAPSCNAICNLTATTFVVSASTFGEPWSWIYTFGAGGNLTKGAPIRTPGDRSAAYNTEGIKLIRLSEEYILLYKSNYSSAQYIESVVILGKVNGDELEFHPEADLGNGAWYPVTPLNDPDALGNTPSGSDSGSSYLAGVAVSDYQAVLGAVDQNTFGGRTPNGLRLYGVERNGLYNGFGLTVSVPTTVSYSVNSRGTLAASTEGKRCFVLVYTDDSYNDTIRHGYFTDGKVSLCGSAQSPTPDRESWNSQVAILDAATGKAFVARQDNVDDKIYGYVFNYSPCHNYFARGYGMSMDKEYGSGVYVTYWDGSDVVMAYHAFTSLVLIDLFYLGPLVNVEHGVKPLTFIGDETMVYVYGKMENPGDLTGTVYIAKSEDGGYTYFPIATETTWGSLGYCGAIWVEPTSEIVAAQNLDGTTKLHWGWDLSMDVAYTMPLAGVNARALVMDSAIGAVYAASLVGADIMLIKLYPPYWDHIDMTYDHGITDGVKSLLLL